MSLANVVTSRGTLFRIHYVAQPCRMGEVTRSNQQSTYGFAGNSRHLFANTYNGFLKITFHLDYSIIGLEIISSLLFGIKGAKK